MSDRNKQGEHNLRAEETKDLVYDIIRTRRSRREFKKEPIKDYHLERILRSARHSASSCNRQAIYLTQPNDKDFLSACLVGGRDWINKAPHILLIWADMRAYKSPFEKDFMPYLDAGFMACTMSFCAEGIGIGSCFVNPQIQRTEGMVKSFKEKFSPGGDFLFCGALVLGYVSHNILAPKKRRWQDLILTKDGLPSR